MNELLSSLKASNQTVKSSILKISNMQRACDNQRCIICTMSVLQNDTALCITVPSKKLKRYKKSTLDTFLLKWDMSAKVNYMHASCFDNCPIQSSVESRLMTEVQETIERFCTFDELQAIVADTVTLLMQSTRIVAFTGAGISASAGIPTYRGTDGIDTLAYLATTAAPAPGVSEKDEGNEEEEEFSYSSLHPTVAHHALAEMNHMCKLDYVVTQNCDNLHQRAGLDHIYLSELHGNVFVEYCEKCTYQYTRDYEVDAFSTTCSNEKWYKKCSDCGWNHYTGRRCTVGRCNGKLKDTIVNFGDDLHDKVLGGFPMAHRQCQESDVCICVGSSLTVSPANELPMLSKARIIVNLQETGLDGDADIRVWATADNFFQLLMPALRHAAAAAAAATATTTTTTAVAQLKEGQLNAGNQKSKRRKVIVIEDDENYEEDAELV